MFFLLLLFGVLIFPQHIFAKTITFTVPTAALTGDQEMIVSASASGFLTDESIHIKGAFYKEGSTNYFGFTKAGDNWIKNSAKTSDQRKVTVQSWDGQLVVKPDYADSGFSDNGAYFFRIGFYTINANGEPFSVNWSTNTVSLSLEKPTATPTPTVVPTRTPTPQPSQTPTLLPTQQATPIPTKTPTRTATRTSTPDQSTSQEDVLGLVSETATPTTTISESIVPTPQPEQSGRAKQLSITFGFIGVGSGILAAMSLVSVLRKKRKEQYE